MTHAELVVAGARWLRNNGYPVVFRELVTTAPETPDVFGVHHYQTAVIECKTSRSDFHADQKKWHRRDGEGVGEFRYYLCPVDLIKKEDLPNKWGLLYASQSGKITLIVGLKPRNCSEIERAEWRHDTNLRRERAIMYSALRRLSLRGHLETIYEKPYLGTNQ